METQDSNKHELSVEKIKIGTLNAECGLFRFKGKSMQLLLRYEKNDLIVNFSLEDISKLEQSYSTSSAIFRLQLRPLAIKRIQDIIQKCGHTFRIDPKNKVYSRFKICFSDLGDDDKKFLEKFFCTVTPIIRDESMEESDEVIVIVDDNQESPVKVKNERKKKLSESNETPVNKKIKMKEDIYEEEISPQRMRPSRSRRCKEREIDITADHYENEDEALQKAINLSLKSVNPSVVQEVLPPIDPDKHANVDKSIELFRYYVKQQEIIVRMEDYLCLERNEYLSDVIIDFYMQYIFNELMSEELREKTYIFPCHFYSLYATGTDFKGWKTEENVGLSAREKRYMRIQGVYDSDVNIFEKDFLVFPLLDHSHWFLSIVCFPNINGSVTYDGGIKVDSNDVYWEKSRAHDPTYNPPALKTSCILIFDSVKGNVARRTAARSHIKNFLITEWENKYQNVIDLDKKNFIANSPPVPQQTNNVDCGCYILEFVQRFFISSPLTDFRLPIELSNWFSSEEVFTKRREIANVIRNKMDSSRLHELPELAFYGDSQEHEKMDLIESNGNDMNGNENNNEEAFNNNNDNYFPDNNQQHVERTENTNENDDNNSIGSPKIPRESVLEQKCSSPSTEVAKVEKIPSREPLNIALVNSEIIAENENNSNTESDMNKSIALLQNAVSNVQDSTQTSEDSSPIKKDPLELDTPLSEESEPELTETQDNSAKDAIEETSIVISD